MTARVPIRFVLGVITVFAACEHGAPFRPEAHGPDGPLVTGDPTRLTFNPGQDLVPAWLPDGSEIVYTGERGDRADHDRCLAFMPAAGGAISRYACRTTTADDSLNVFEDAALAGDGIAYMRVSTERFLQGIGPDRQELVVAPIRDPNDARVVQRVPFTAAWGVTYDALSHIAWLDAGRLAAIGERVTYPRPCSSCAPDTVRIGIGALIVDIASASPVMTQLPDGDSASSLAAAANGDTIYFTKVGDSRVYRHTLSTGQTDTLVDFSFAGVARDISVANGKLVAVVGGAAGSATQPDRGGGLLLVTASGIVAQIGDPTWLFRRPALSPSGSQLVVTATNGTPNTDLWLFEFR